MHVKKERKFGATLQGNEGFSLLEMVIVLAIFSITILVATDIFIATSKNQRRFTSFQSVESDTRYVVNTITKKIQFGGVDFAFYADPDRNPGTNDAMAIADTGNHVLAVRDEDRNQIIFRKAGSEDHPWDGAGTEMEVCFNNDENVCMTDINAWAKLNSKDVSIDALTFFISPKENPWIRTNDGRYVANEHPRVTLVYVAKDVDHPAQRLRLQTTVTSRIYER